MNGLLYEVRDRTAWLTLDRPDVGNAIDIALASRLFEAASTAAVDDAVRCVVLTGRGRLFCAGGDIAAFAQAGDQAGAFLGRLASELHRAIAILATMAKPLLVLVNGPAAGAGLSLTLLGDIVLAARSAHFTAAYSAIGLTADGGMSWLLPRLVGLRRAQAMMLTNERVNAEQALSIGLLTRVVDDEQLDSEGSALAARLVTGPTAALGATRRLLLDGATDDFLPQLEREAAAIAAAADHSEAREGIAAFLARRTPNFKGA